MEPVEIRRRRWRLRVDDDGVTIGRKPTVPWSDVVAVGVQSNYEGYPPIVAPLPWPGVTLALVVVFAVRRLSRRPTKQQHPARLCVKGREYTLPIRALVLTCNGQAVTPAERDENIATMRAALGPWFDRIPLVSPPNIDVAVWWLGHGGARAVPTGRVEDPLDHEHTRAVSIGHELDDLNDQLRRIQHREDRDR